MSEASEAAITDSTPSTLTIPNTPSTLTIPNMESFIISSTDHQDGLFRLVQYATRLLGALHVGRKRDALFGITNSIDAARIMTRTFGVVYAARAALTPHARTRDLIADLALCGYHPSETAYWLLLSTNSPRSERRRTFGRLASLFGLIWCAIHGASAYTRMRDLVKQRDEAVAAAAADGDGDGDVVGAVEAELARVRKTLAKLILDGLLSLHWALDHHTLKLSHLFVGLFGSCSALLGLNLQWGAHLAQQHQMRRLTMEEEDEEDEEDDDEYEDAEEEYSNGNHGYGLRSKSKSE